MSADLVRARIDEGPVVPLMWLVVLLGFLLNLADGIDVGSCAEVKSQVVRHSSVHNSTGTPFHRVIETRVYNILF